MRQMIRDRRQEDKSKDDWFVKSREQMSDVCLFAGAAMRTRRAWGSAAPPTRPNSGSTSSSWTSRAVESPSVSVSLDWGRTADQSVHSVHSPSRCRPTHR